MVLRSETYFKEISDALGLLGYQLQMRGEEQLFDLHKHSENFAKRLLNEIWGTNLRDLNAERSNEPGIDLADDEKSIAVQVTADKRKAKITATLQKVISEGHHRRYNKIIVLILGKKQVNGYNLDEELLRGTNFDTEQDIIDISDLRQSIARLNPPHMLRVLELIKSEITGVYEDFRLSQNGQDMPAVADKPDIQYQNCLAWVEYQNSRYQAGVDTDGESEMSKVFINFLNKLHSLPNSTRRFFANLVSFVNVEDIGVDVENITLSYSETIRSFVDISHQQFKKELQILLQQELIIITDEEEPNPLIKFSGECAIGCSLFHVIDFCTNNNFSIEKPLYHLDFSDFAI